MNYMSKIAVAGIALAMSGAAAQAETKWDLSTAWPATNFQAKTAIAFADAVREETNGSVDITVHLSGEIGVKISEKLSAVENGIVQMADMLLFLQAGEEPLLSIDTLPYLIQGQDEMKAFLDVAGPTFDEIAARHNQKILYYVPWPAQHHWKCHGVMSPQLQLQAPSTVQQHPLHRVLTANCGSSQVTSILSTGRHRRMPSRSIWMHGTR